MILTACLTTALLVTFTALWVSVQKNIEFSDRIDEIQESIQISIDTLNKQHMIMESKTKIEVFSDEPIVRDLVRDIKIAKNSVLTVAKLLDETVQLESLSDE